MTITPVLKTNYKLKDNTYKVVVRLSHGHKQRLIPTGYSVRKDQWRSGSVCKHAEADVINICIDKIVTEAKEYKANCHMRRTPINLNAIGKRPGSSSFNGYILARAVQYGDQGKFKVKQKLERLAFDLQQCFKTEIYFSEINTDKLRALDAYLIVLGNQNNYRKKKFKTYRLLFTNAFDEGKTNLPNPFKGYKITSTPVKKEKLTAIEIKRMEGLELTGMLNDCRNLFLFAFYSKGLRFENCITLRRSAIRDGRIYVTTNKGKKHISILIHSRLQHILDQYPGKGFVFPFIKDLPAADTPGYKKVIESINSVVNRHLKIIAAAAQIVKKVTFHTSRHTFAYQLKQKTGNINAIQDALGHSDQKTTQMYLESLDDEILDAEMKKLYGE